MNRRAFLVLAGLVPFAPRRPRPKPGAGVYANTFSNIY